MISDQGSITWEWGARRPKLENEVQFYVSDLGPVPGRAE